MRLISKMHIQQRQERLLQIIRSVSYTHLDVYKRQIPAHVDDIAIVIRIGVLSFFEGIVIPFEIHGANLELSNFVVGTGVPNGVVAVYQMCIRDRSWNLRPCA